MSTICQIFIKNINLTKLEKEIKENFNFGRIKYLNIENQALFYDNRNECFILSNSYVNNWIEFSYQPTKTIHELDDFLISISKKYNTKVLFGYEQTTTADAKFIFYENGLIKRYIYQEYDCKKDIIIHKIDTGKKLETENNFKYPKVGNNLKGFHLLDYDDIQNLFIECGYQGVVNEKNDENYIHIEKRKTAHNNSNRCTRGLKKVSNR